MELKERAKDADEIFFFLGFIIKILKETRLSHLLIFTIFFL